MQRPSIYELVRAVRTVAATVGATTATYCFEGRIAVSLEAGWSLVLSSDDAGRFRVEACHSGRVRATMWCLADDDDRLAELASSAEREAAALVA
jgi:hypothetical protein